MNRGDGYDPETHTYYLAGRRVPGVTEILKAAGVIDATFLRDEAALRRGTIVHMCCELADKERVAQAVMPSFQMFGDMGAYAGYLDAYKRFQHDHAPRYTHVEAGMLHATLRFGGRSDRICADLCGQGPAILEIKTGHEAAWHGVQLAAYQMLFPTGSRWVVYLRPDGRYKLRRASDPADYGRFMQALADYRDRRIA